MNNRKKFALIAVVVVVLLAIVGFTVQQSHKGVVAVQTGKVVREDLTSVVTASGEIKPKVYVNIGANAFAKITHLYVKEGDRVKRGQMLALLDNVQPAADVSANDSALNASRTDAIAAQAAVNTAVADLNSAEASLDHAKTDYERNKALYDQQLISKSDYDVKKTAYDTAVAQVGMSKAKLAQAKASLDSAQGHINQNQAMLRHAADVLSKTQYEAPFDGIITNVPVREGETVVPGIQNSPGSTLMTIGDTSVITAEVQSRRKRYRQRAVRSAGRSHDRRDAQAEVQGNGHRDRQKCLVALHRRIDGAVDLERPGGQGLQSRRRVAGSSSERACPDSRLPRASRPPSEPTVLAIPIQALTIRERGELNPGEQGQEEIPCKLLPPAADDPKEDLQGVFVIRNKKDAVFVPVATGISGTTDIEVNSGLEGRRRDCHWQLQGAAHVAERRQRED